MIEKIQKIQNINRDGMEEIWCLCVAVWKNSSRSSWGQALEPFAPWVAGWLGEQKAHHKKVREWRREKAQISARQKVDRGRMAPVKKLEEQLKKMADDLFDEPPPHGAGLEFGHDIHQPKIMRPTRSRPRPATRVAAPTHTQHTTLN